MVPQIFCRVSFKPRFSAKSVSAKSSFQCILLLKTVHTGYLLWQTTTTAFASFQEERFVLRHMERQEPQGEENGDLAAFAHHHGLSPRHQVPTVPGGQLPTSVNHQVITHISQNILSRPIEMRMFHRNERCRISAILQHKFANLPSKPYEYRRKFENPQLCSDHVQNVYWYV